VKTTKKLRPPKQLRVRPARRSPMFENERRRNERDER
jgi:hypothetical protein